MQIYEGMYNTMQFSVFTGVDHVTAASVPQCSSAHTRWGQIQCLLKKSHTENLAKLFAASHH